MDVDYWSDIRNLLNSVHISFREKEQELSLFLDAHPAVLANTIAVLVLKVDLLERDKR